MSRRLLTTILLLSLPGLASPRQSKESHSLNQSGASSNQLADVLERVGEQVQRYADGMLRVICRETARQQEVEADLTTPKNKPRELVYDLMIVRQPASAKQPRPEIAEIRQLVLADGKPSRKPNEAPYPAPGTAYTTALLFLLPKNQASYTFSYVGEAEWQGRKALAVDFTPAKREPPEVTWKGGFFRANFQRQGRVWIDPISYDVLQLDAHLIEPFEFKSPRTVRKGPFFVFGPSRKFKIEKWDLTIRFRLTPFQDPQQVLLLPESAETVRVIQGSRVPRLRTTHSFTNYKRFTGEIKIQDQEIRSADHLTAEIAENAEKGFLSVLCVLCGFESEWYNDPVTRVDSMAGLMKGLSRLRGHLSGGDLAFIAVLIAAYLSMVSYLRRSFDPLELGLLIVASVAYLVIGIWGFAACKRAGSLRAALLYFAIQIPLAAAILQLSSAGLMFLIMLPLAGQSVHLLPRRWMIAVSAVIMLTLILPVLLRSGWAVAERVGLMYLVGMVFVIVFTQIAVNERKARAEVERLAAELRRYAAQVEELAITKERNRVAREIHDSLGHYLTVINVQLEAARAVINSDCQRALDALSKAQTLAQKALADVRRSVTALRASPIEDLPLAEVLAKLVDECSAAGIATELVVTGAPRPLTSQARLALYRAAQEGLTNVRKHSRATRATLTLDYSKASTVRLEVYDNGMGRRDGEEGFGLLGMRERAQLLNGQVRIRTAAGRGVTLEVELPG